MGSQMSRAWVLIRSAMGETRCDPASANARPSLCEEKPAWRLNALLNAMRFPQPIWLLGAALTLVPALGGLGTAQAAENGEALFLQKCAACHQSNGQGIKGAFPALAADAYVAGEPNQLAHLVLTGRAGMPSFRQFLKDEELAAILTYVRSAWGNNFGPLPATIVTEERHSLNEADGHPLGN